MEAERENLNRFMGEQIKSATDNAGTFDRNNSNIRFSMDAEEEETDQLSAVHSKAMSGLRRMIECDGVPFPCGKSRRQDPDLCKARP